MMRGFESYCRLLRNPIFVLIWFALAVFSYFYWDRHLTEFFQQANQINGLFKIGYALSFFGYGSTSLIPLALLAIIAWCLKRRELAAIAIFIVLAVLFSGAICDIIKFIV
ncbi:MAG: hypothetical protein K0U12_04410, partial [Gammaproteobacteria bacterium]|nr:hypothetical protein [Gammaproteobacteria bacterium]